MLDHCTDIPKTTGPLRIAGFASTFAGLYPGRDLRRDRRVAFKFDLGCHLFRREIKAVADRRRRSRFLLADPNADFVDQE